MRKWSLIIACGLLSLTAVANAQSATTVIARNPMPTRNDCQEIYHNITVDGVLAVPKAVGVMLGDDIEDRHVWFCVFLDVDGLMKVRAAPF
jgi:hypothetical protein